MSPSAVTSLRFSPSEPITSLPSDFDYCSFMAWENETPIRWALGNTKWHAIETDVAGRLEFQLASPRPGVMVERLLAIRLSEALPLRSERIVYLPHAYQIIRDYVGDRRTETLVFPPARQGAVLLVDHTSPEPVQSQMLLYSKLNDGPFYPDYDPVARIYTIQKAGFWIKVSFDFDDLREWISENAWQAARAGFRSAGHYRMVLAFGQNEAEAESELAVLRQLGARAEDSCRNWWNDYFRSCPLVSLTAGLTLRHEVFGEDVPVDKAEFLKRQLWHYQAALGSIVDVPWCPMTPAQPAERYRFNQVFTNDNAHGIMALALTNRAHYARAHLVNFIRFMIQDDGQLIWSAKLTGERTSYPACHGVPVIPQALGHYIRCTGDASILDEDAGGRTVWEKIKLYHSNLLRHRDTNGDGLIEWNHIWENGEDNKVSPFFRKQGLLVWYDFYERHQDCDVTQTDFYRDNICPVTVLNEQVFLLWSLREMADIATLRGENAAPYLEQENHILNLLSTRHWDADAGFYFDYDVRENKLHQAKNLDALYFLYFERDPSRAARLMAHLNNPAEFSLVMLPSLSRDDLHFDPESYWAGAAWPREQGLVAIGVHQQGHTPRAFDIMVKALMAEKGPIISETVNPLTNPMHSHGYIRTMCMASVNLPILLDICGLNNWAGTVRTTATDLPVTLLQTPTR